MEEDLYVYKETVKLNCPVVCRSVFLTTWHCILSARLTKNALLQTGGR